MKTISNDKDIRLGEVQDYILDDSKQERQKLLEAEDNLKMVQQTGYKPELRRNFTTLSLLGVGFSITNSWVGISASLVAGISSGGPMLIIYGIIIVAFISIFIGISLSELISAIPSAGGQYVWTMQLAPKKYARFWAYMCGAVAWAGAIFTCASVTISIAEAIVGMYILGTGDPNREVKPWQVFVTFQILNALLSLFNIWEKPLPTIARIALGISLCGFFIITITILAKSSGHYQPAHFVFVDFNNATGWSSSGIAFIVGLINPTWSFSCLDSATHMAEEILQPERKIPTVIMTTVAIAFGTSFLYSISMFFCITNLDEILGSNTGVPIMDIFHQALQSKAGALVLESIIVLSLFTSNISCHTWQARLAWSFSRDNGLPGSRYWSKVNQKTGFPVNAHLMSIAWCAIVGCIFLGSETAYNAMVVGCITFGLLSYAIPVVCLLYKGRNNIKHGPFWLGPLGLVSNVMLVAWTIFACVFYSFPFDMPTKASTMNYASAVLVGFILYALVYWAIRGRYVFKGVDERVEEAEILETELSNDIQRISHSAIIKTFA